MPAFLGPLVGFALGVLLAWISQTEVVDEDDRVLRERRLIALLLGTLVLAPACAYFLIFWGDWSYAYLVDARRVPSAVELLIVVLDGAAVPLGFSAARLLAPRRDPRRMLAVGGLPAALALALVVALFPRLRIQGTYQEVHERFGTQPVEGQPLGYAILWMNAMVVAGVILAARSVLVGPSVNVLPVTAQADVPEPLLGRRTLGRAKKP